MAERSLTVELRPQTLRRPNGLIVAVRLHAPKIADLWFWLNRDGESLEELRPYCASKLSEDSTG